MSHQPERKEKNCLNCGTTVLGRYCHVCGQENVETKESFFSLLKHFVYDIFHFDSQFFDTLKYVLFRPGYLSWQYVEGKRVRYLHPIRMYLFTSAIFFLVLFSFRDPVKHGAFDISGLDKNVSKQDRLQTIQELQQELKEHPGDSTRLRLIEWLRDTSKAITFNEIAKGRNNGVIEFDNKRYQSVAAYDSVQKQLPPNQRDGWLTRQFLRRGIALNSKYQGNASEGFREFFELFTHKLSYLLFVSLPFFALILKLLYVRRNQFYYSDHAVFTLHFYIFGFILLLIVFLLGLLSDWTHFKLFQKLIPFLLFLWPVYLLVAMRNFYQQGWGKTFSKFLLLNLLALIVLLLLFALFLFFTFFQL